MNADLELALQLAHAADAVTMKHFASPFLSVRTKADHTPVSAADEEVEQMIRDTLAKERPNDAIVGEEFGSAEGERRWIIDPIDATNNYIRGIPVFATLIALLSMLMARVGATHLTISEAAALRKHMTGRGSVAGIRKLIARGVLTLEIIPGTRTSGIAIEQVYPQWLPIAAARAALEREHAERERQVHAQS